MVLTGNSASVCVLSGRSGSGKTTLINLLAGLLHPSTGTVRLDGTALYDLPDAARAAFRRRHLSIIPQGDSLLRTLTVEENLLLPSVLAGRPASSTRLHEILELLEIDALAPLLPGALSGGELKRAAVARALLSGCPTIFADEPTGDLDEARAARVTELLADYAAQGHLVLVASHDPQVLHRAGRLFNMQQGVPIPA